jgi:hypothetical protein
MFWYKDLDSLQHDRIHVRIYMGKDRQNAAQTMTSTCMTVRSLTWRVEKRRSESSHGQFSSLGLFDDLHARDIKSTVVGLSDKIIKEC